MRDDVTRLIITGKYRQILARRHFMKWSAVSFSVFLKIYNNSVIPKLCYRVSPNGSPAFPFVRY